jgi:hypothetical protein
MNAQDTAKDKPGMYLPDYSIRPAAPVIAFGTASAITDLDPQVIKDACPGCHNPAFECICIKREG